MNIPLPPSPRRRDSNEYSPSQITSPHTDDDEVGYKTSKYGSFKQSGGASSSQDASPSNSGKKVSNPSKKRMAGILKSFKLSSTTKSVIQQSKKPSRSSSSSAHNDSTKSYEDDEDAVDGLLEAEFNKQSSSGGGGIGSFSDFDSLHNKSETLSKNRESERSSSSSYSRKDRSKDKSDRDQKIEQRKLNIESIIEEETIQKKHEAIPARLDNMPNKAGSSFQKTMSAAGPVEMDLYNQQKAEENALKLAASFSNANKGPVVLDNFGFVSVQRPIGKSFYRNLSFV